MKTDENLNTIIDFSQSEGFNIEKNSEIKEIFGFGGVIKSYPNDPYILLNISFRELVHISGIMVEGCMEKGNFLYYFF